MRFIGLAYVGVLVVALTAFRMYAGVEPAPAGAPTDALASVLSTETLPESAIEPIQAAEPVGTEAAEAAEPPEVQPETVAPPSRRRRSRRRRRPLRYPDAPTPAEWVAPEGPVRIALQAGHWRANEAPQELSSLRGNGTSWRGTAEWEMNLAIVESAAAMLEGMGYEVDILPAVVPPAYRAHLFIAVHADGSNDPNASGYRVASPRGDVTGRAPQIAALLEQSYGEATGIRALGTVTRRMENYYAFNFQRYEHALHPMTIGVILETGFLTSSRDRRVIVDDPARAARGIVDAVAAFAVTPPPGVAVDR